MDLIETFDAHSLWSNLEMGQPLQLQNISDSSVANFVHVDLEPHCSPNNNLKSEDPTQHSAKATATESRANKKIKRNTGLKYTSHAGKVVQERKLIPLTACRAKCNERITLEDQTRMFNAYWGEGTYRDRVKYVKSLIKLVPKARCRKSRRESKQTKHRKVTCSYYLRAAGNQPLQKVCKRCFLSSLGETSGFVDNCLKQLSSMSGATSEDRRGKHAPPNKTPISQSQEIKNHICKFPSYESHASRVTSTKYLAVGLSPRLMYSMYLKEVSNPVSLRVYRRILSENHLKFKQPKHPKLNTCRKCDKFDSLLRNATDDLNNEHLLKWQKNHHDEANAAYLLKEEDKLYAHSSDGRCIFATFSFQQCLPTPMLKTNEAFYKRQLWTYNLTVSTPSSAICYMWHEGVAKRGANELASCLLHFINHLQPGVKQVVLYSASAGQYKNYPIAACLSTILHYHPSIETIEHKFLDPGHAQIECDSVHSAIEKANRNEIEIHHPEDWYNLVQTVNRNNPFQVVVMDQSLFFNFEKLLENILVKRQKNLIGDPFLWHPVKWVKYSKALGVVYYKNRLQSNDCFKKIDLKKSQSNTYINLERRYCAPNTISSEKKKDLMDVLQLLRPEVHDFYTNLTARDSTRNIDPDLDGIESEADETSDTTRNVDSDLEDSQSEGDDISDITSANTFEGKATKKRKVKAKEECYDS